MSEQSITDVFKEATGMSIGWAVVMIVLGFLAVFLPYQTGIGISVLVGWIMVFGGVAYVAYAFAAPGAGAVLWRMLVGLFYVSGGGYLAFHPGLALESLTLVVAAVYLAEGFFQGRSSFSTWHTRIVINATLMARRRKRARPEASLDDIPESQLERLPLGVADARPDPEKICAVNESNALVEEHVRQLPPLLPAALRLKVTHGLTITESSSALGIRVSAYKARVYRARQKLARGLRQSLETGRVASGFGTRGHQIRASVSSL
jgi:RNA polymerase sigma factor (sigma-70 family)